MADTPAPCVYLVYGDDRLVLQAFEAELVKKMGDPGLAELNITRLDGRTAALEDLQNAVLALPFLADRRLVILRSPSLAGREQDSRNARFLALLDSVPETTRLVLLVEDTWSGKDWDWEKLKSSHWLLKWARKAGPRVYIKEARLPAPASMPKWILDHAREMGGAFERPAAEQLAAYIGSDTSLAAQEMEKLFAYVNYSRPVEAEDVQLLTTAGAHADVFTLVDAMAAGERSRALHELEVLLQEQDPNTLFGMIARQFRLLIQARDLMDDGGTPRELEQLGIHSYVAGKLMVQARRFELGQLLAIYRRLLDVDEQVKSGQMPIELALEVFLAEV